MLFLFSGSNFVYAQEQESSVIQQDENCFCDPNSDGIVRLVDDLATLMSSYYPEVKQLLGDNSSKTVMEVCYPKERIEPIMKTIEELTRHFSDNSKEIKEIFQDILNTLEAYAGSTEKCNEYDRILYQKIKNLMSFFQT